jgi:hypothetical protein
VAPAAEAVVAPVATPAPETVVVPTPDTTASTEVLEAKPAPAAVVVATPAPAPAPAQKVAEPVKKPESSSESMPMASGDTGKESLVENPWEFVLVTACFAATVLLIMFTGEK